MPVSVICGRSGPGSPGPVTEPAGIPEAVSDPVGVAADLITGADPGLDGGEVEAVVVAVAGGRAKRRKLAQALAQRPAVLTDGRSPAPRVVGDLLIALVKAGAMAVSPPVCAECGKALRTLQRRGQDWYCSVCGPARQQCARCGGIDRVTGTGGPGASGARLTAAVIRRRSWPELSRQSIRRCRRAWSSRR